jgi:hypothetical protein
MIRYFISTKRGFNVEEFKLRKRNQLILANQERCKELLNEIQEIRFALKQKIKRCA